MDSGGWRTWVDNGGQRWMVEAVRSVVDGKKNSAGEWKSGVEKVDWKTG